MYYGRSYDTVLEDAVKGWLVVKALVTLEYCDQMHSVIDIPPFNAIRVTTVLGGMLYRSVVRPVTDCFNRRRVQDEPNTTDQLTKYFRGVLIEGESMRFRYSGDPWYWANLRAQRHVLEDAFKIHDRLESSKQHMHLLTELADDKAAVRQRDGYMEVRDDLKKSYQMMERLRCDAAAYKTGKFSRRSLVRPTLLWAHYLKAQELRRKAYAVCWHSGASASGLPPSTPSSDWSGQWAHVQ